MVSFQIGLRYLLYNRRLFFDALVKRLRIFIPDELYLKLRYRFKVGEWPNLKNPKTFSEKINWLKLHNKNEEYTMLVDKYEVKRQVEQSLGKEYIIPTLGVWDKPEDINWDILPTKFVLKTTHAGGGRGVIIILNKDAADRSDVNKQLNKSLRYKAGSGFREYPYYNVKKRIIAEEYIENNNKDSNGLVDYKFFCFNGRPLYCQVIRDRHTKETIDFYDMQWNHLPFVGLNPLCTNGAVGVERPNGLSTMIDISEKLSKDKSFVRVDLYNIDGRILFGELTFFPAGGMGEFMPKEWNTIIGSQLNL